MTTSPHVHGASQASAPLPTQGQKDQAKAWYEQLQTSICEGLEQIEASFLGTASNVPVFRRKSWERTGGGGGTMALLGGNVFEKAGVNVSTVWGAFSPDMQAQVPGAQENPHFWASGISLVIHPRSPHVPAIHMNTRHIVTSCSWFGGGIDLTPVFPREEDSAYFHEGLREVCDAFHPTYYPHFKQWADTYFYLPHRQEARGIGGIFYDSLNSGDWQRDFAFNQAVGERFLPLYRELVMRHLQTPWTPAEKEAQRRKRGRYVEFNLLYDRGTQFGLRTGGNVEAILMSLPPEVAWPLPLNERPLGEDAENDAAL
ncbi:MAG: oxygen-dependent coproporphyrinogen oxidase [Alphaproteobacteria bacterium]